MPYTEYVNYIRTLSEQLKKERDQKVAADKADASRQPKSNTNSMLSQMRGFLSKSNPFKT